MQCSFSFFPSLFYLDVVQRTVTTYRNTTNKLVEELKWKYNHSIHSIPTVVRKVLWKLLKFIDFILPATSCYWTILFDKKACLFNPSLGSQDTSYWSKTKASTYIVIRWRLIRLNHAIRASDFVCSILWRKNVSFHALEF